MADRDSRQAGLILALDQGTTSSRALLISQAGEVLASARQAFTQIYPQPGWVEHDPRELLASQISALTGVLVQANVDPTEIAGIGISNQRETTVVWERQSGEPIYNAIVWQCRRTAGWVEELCSSDEVADLIAAKTGLLPDAYFSASKIAWILDNVPGARLRAERGELAFGTIDSWLVWQLTAGQVHATDTTNASRTMLFDIHTAAWDEELLELFGIPAALLPEVRPSAADYGRTAHPSLPAGLPICSVVGDQQAALFGQRCYRRGDTKATLGTGCFMLMHTGHEACMSKNRLITTVAASAPGRSAGGYGVGAAASAAVAAVAAAGAASAAPAAVAAAGGAASAAPAAVAAAGGSSPLVLPGQLEYALEGSIFVAGALIQWLRDELGLLRTAAESEDLANQVADTAGVHVIPAFTGLGAPWWVPEARGAILGLTRGARREHIVRASLESLAFQGADLLAAFAADVGITIAGLKVDGGAAANGFLMQFMADVLNAVVRRPQNPEATALGAAFLAGLQAGVWQDLDELLALDLPEEEFSPKISETERQALLDGWHRALATVLAREGLVVP